MLKTNKIIAAAALTALMTNLAFADDKSAAMVNGVSIPQSRLDMQVKAITQQQGQPDTPELRKAIRERMVEAEVIRQAAVAQGLDKTPEVVAQFEMAKQSILANAYMQGFMKKNPVGEAQMKEEYNRFKSEAGDKEYNARHILVKTKEEALAIIDQLNKKVDFKKLAEKSLDKGSASNGGSLGWNVPATFVPPFADALKRLKKGEMTKEPVQSQFGYHVIVLDDTREAKLPSFDELKPQIQQSLQQQLARKEVDSLRAKAKIE